MSMPRFFTLSARWLMPMLVSSAMAATEADYYPITTFTTPPGTALEVGSVELLPDDRLALGTRRGEIWIVKGAHATDPAAIGYQLFASGLHEVLGLAYKDGALYATTRYEITKITDSDGDGRGDVFDCFSAPWGVSGDYHEYSFGSSFDRNGDLWTVHCLTGSFGSAVPFRGWALRHRADGSVVPTCSGIRSPGGIGFDLQGECYYTDNQGPWHGSSTLQHLVPGSFQGHPAGNVWYDRAPNMGPRPLDPIPEAYQNGRPRNEANPAGDPDRMVLERRRIKQLLPPVVYMVHGKIGNSSSAVICDVSQGKFGPFAGQMFIADQSHSNLSRVCIETINGIRQGAVIPFRSGFKSGPIGGRMDAHGHLFLGGSDRGWGARGGQPFSFERVQWSGKLPFEIHEMRAKAKGFELSFTQPLDAASLASVNSSCIRAFTYAYREQYGGDEIDEVKPSLSEVSLSEDGRTLRFSVQPLTQGHIHELHLDGLRNTKGEPLLHSVAYYTLNEIPR